MKKTCTKILSSILVLLLLSQVCQAFAYAFNSTDKGKVKETVNDVTETSTDEKIPDIVCEIEENRTEFSKDFLLEDGSFCSIISSIPLHNRNNKNWVDILESDRDVKSVENILGSIQTMDVLNSESRQENNRAETTDNLTINWGTTRAVFGGRHIVEKEQYFAVKPVNINQYLSNNKLVVYAGISANCTVSSISQTYVYEINSSWTNEGIIPGFGENNILTIQSLPITQVSQTYFWDITDLYSRWDRGETENNGVAIRNEINGNFTVMNPCLVIRYLEVESNDLDYTYHSCDINKAGTLYMNDATTTFRIDQKLIGLRYANYEFNVSRSYDSTDNSPVDNVAGAGMKFNYESSISMYNDYVKWIMPNGNTTKFIPSSPLQTQGDYQLWTSVNSIGNFAPKLWVKTSEMTMLIQTGNISYSNLYIEAEGLKYTFYNNGCISAIKEIDSNDNIFTFTYNSNNLLTRVVSESDGNYLSFNYEINDSIGGYFIESITAKDSTNEPISDDLEVRFSSELSDDCMELLQSVKYNDETSCNYIYDFYGRLISIKDEQNNIYEIEYANNAGSNTIVEKHIIGYSSYRENESSPYDSLLINKENTYLRTFRYFDGSSDSIGYDNQFRVCTYKDSDGKYKCINYGDGNTYIALSGENEFVQNNQFELSGLSHWNIDTNNNLISISNVHSRSGNALRFINGDDGHSTLSAYQEIVENGTKKVFEADKTYVVGGWLYTTNNILDANNEIGILIEAASVDDNRTIGDTTAFDYSEIGFIQFDNTIHDSWQYKLLGFKLEESSVIRIKLQYNNQKNAVFFDDITLFESITPNSNLDMDEMLISNPIEYSHSNGLITGESITWERENDTDLYMSTSYSYGNNNKLQEYVDYNGNSTYYKYNSRTGQLTGEGHTLDNGIISDLKSFQYDSSSLLTEAEQTIKNIESNNNIILNVEYDNTFGRVEDVKHNGFYHVFEYNTDGTLASTYADSDYLLSYNNDEYNMDYTYSNGEISVIDYSNDYRIKYLPGTNSQGNTTKTIECYTVNGETETLIKSYLYEYDENGNLYSVFDSISGLTVTYTSTDLSSYEISDYELIYKRTVDPDGTVSEQYRQRSNNSILNTSFDTVETSGTSILYNSDGTRTIASTESIDKNISYYNQGAYYHGNFNYEKESIRDYFDRLSNKYVEMNYQRDNTPGNIFSQVEYDFIDFGNGRTSSLVSDYSQSFYTQNSDNSTLTYQTYNRKYEYDNKGNIKFVYEESGNNIVPKQYYEYDNANQIVTEINFESQISAHYTYDAGGNLTAKVYYNFSALSFNITDRRIVSLGQEIRRVSYQYDSVWKDRVVYYSDTGFTDDNIDDSIYQAISYDKMGNPLNYVGDKTLDLAHFAIQSRSSDRIIVGNLEWNGNLLVSFETDTNRYEYGYDANGYRVTKTTFNKTENSGNTTYEKMSITDYIWDNGVLSGIAFSSIDSQGQRINTQTAMIVYDQEGAPTGYVSLTGVPYLFKKDLNENVVSLVYIDGSDICSTSYDAWGNPQLTLYGNFIQQAVTLVTIQLCPSTYHGYLYDYENGMYFNQGRCYSPSWGRYISPESPEKLTERSDNPLDSNLYLFCDNNTVNTLDTVASWSRDYTGLDWKANGFDIKMNEMFASRSMCMLVANDLIKKYGSWSPESGYNLYNMNSLRISSDLFAHYIGKTATASINKVNACWGDGWILNNKKSDIIRIRSNDINAEKYEKIWIAAPEIKGYAQKDGVFISL